MRHFYDTLRIGLGFIALLLLGLGLGAGGRAHAGGAPPARGAVPPLNLSPSPTVTPTYTPHPCTTIQGSITNSDPTQAGGLNPNGPTSVCRSSSVCPGVVDDSPRHYDVYRIAYQIRASTCITIQVAAPACTGANAVISAIYYNFNPANLCASYQAGTAISPGGSYSFYIFCCGPSAFDLVVAEANPGAGCRSYTVTILSDITCPSTLTPTPDPTPTYTPFPTRTPGLSTPTGTPTATTQVISPTPSATETGQPATVVPTPSATGTGQTPTVIITPTGTPCSLVFTDVPATSPFYPYIRCLACRGLVSGYPCGGPGEPCPGAYYRPNNNVTRGQVSKIVAAAAGFADPVPSSQQTFADVPPGSTFWGWVEQLAGRGVIGGYPCGGPFEPCVAPLNRPYFRPNNNVTRGQLSKITSGAAGWTETPTGQTFEDVAPNSTFYVYIERVASRGIIGGYPCGGPFEPCVAPGNRPYFRPNNPATRGQLSKIAALAFFPNCPTPARR